MTIDPEFKSLIPPLSREEYHDLEESILKDGIRDSLIVWDCNGEWILIDGHNRYEIAQKHNLPYNQRRMEFESREDAKLWMLRNQLGRRNLNTYNRSVLALQFEEIIKAKAKEKQSEAGGAVRQKSDKAVIDTKKELAKIADVSHDTIHKVKVIQQKAPEEVKQALKKDEITINKAYTNILASEHETRQQEADREFREANKRHKEYIENKSSGAVSFMDAKQDKEDARLISQKFYKDFYDKGSGIGLIHTEITNKGIDYLLKGATDREIYEMISHLTRWHGYIIHIIRLLEERRLNEK